MFLSLTKQNDNLHLLPYCQIRNTGRWEAVSWAPRSPALSVPVVDVCVPSLRSCFRLAIAKQVDVELSAERRAEPAGVVGNVKFPIDILADARSLCSISRAVRLLWRVAIAHGEQQVRPTNFFYAPVAKLEKRAHYSTVL